MLTLSSTLVNVSKGDVVPMNIIQHPDGKPKKVTIRTNLATAADVHDIRYFTSTLGGSSGSPVFNENWQLVALNRGSIGTKVLRFQGRTTAILNMGTRILSILSQLPAALKKDMVLKSDA